MGATTSMTIPMVAVTGVRQTVNANLTPAQTTWNLRSALNVAALNCLDLKYAGLVDNYGAFLKRNSKQLAAANKAIQGEFRTRYGASYRDEQDGYMTQVYNYFALPPAKNEFCDVSFAISNEALQVAPEDLPTYSSVALTRIENAFESFFSAYEQYRVDLRAWDSLYGAGAVTGVSNPVVGTVGDPVTAPVVIAGSSAPATSAGGVEPAASGQTPIVIDTGETNADGTPSTALPTEGPIFQSGEVVQGEAGAGEDIPPGESDDTPVP